MPRHAKRRTTRRGRKVHHRHRKSAIRSSLGFTDFSKPFPPELHAVLPWYVNTAFTGVTSNIGNFLIDATSCFRPHYTTSSGAQPFGYDQLAPYYKFLRVNKMKYEITFYAVGNNKSRVGYIMYADSEAPDYTSSASFEQLTQQFKSKWKAMNTGGAAQVRFRGTIFPNRIIGVSGLKYKIGDGFSETTNTTIGGSNNGVTTHVILAPITESADASSEDSYVMVRTWYDVTFFGRKTLPVS